jgi:hypothetical protein
MTQEARQRLDQYLHQVHTALSGCRSVSAEEVERDIREHIALEFESTTDAVSVGQLDPVLARLGRPDQWVPQQEPPLWRRVLLRLRRGPEDWRLAYLVLILLVVGFVFPPLLLYVLPLTWLMSRAALAVARDRNESLGPQRWFLYPSLVIVNAGLVLILLLGPTLLAAAIGESLWHGDPAWPGAAEKGYRQLYSSPEAKLTFVALVIGGATAVWWVVLGVILSIWPATVQAVFRPFAEGFGRRHALMLAYLGLALGVLCGAAVAFGMLQ